MQRLTHSRTEEEFEDNYKKATEKAASVGLDPPSEVPEQARRRKVPAKFRLDAKSAMVDHAFPTLQEYYRSKVYYVFVDTMTKSFRDALKEEIIPHGTS